MNKLESAIQSCAEALVKATETEVDDAVRHLDDEQVEMGIILHAIRAAWRIHDAASNNRTILHVVWPEGASMTLDHAGDVSLADLVSGLRANRDPEAEALT